MTYIVKVAVCSQIRTKHSTQSKHHVEIFNINPLNTELNPICQLLVLLGTHPILYISRLRVNESHYICTFY
jgi:hypothetical protein